MSLNFRNFENMSTADRRELLKSLRIAHSNIRYEESHARYEKKRRAEKAKEAKLVDFLNNITLVREKQGWGDSNTGNSVVSMARFATGTHHEQYNDALRMIAKGFEQIDRVKNDHIAICEREGKPASDYFYTTEKRMNKELKRQENIKRARAEWERGKNWGKERSHESAEQIFNRICETGK